jgi:hypothetical protein
MALMPSLRMMRRHWPSAWTWLSTVLMSVSFARAGHHLVVDGQKPLADDMQARLRQQMVDVGDAAGDRVLDRDHAQIGLARGDRGQRILEGGAGQGSAFGNASAGDRGNWRRARPGMRSS